MPKVLIVRTDRLGDVLLTTPVSSALRAANPKTHIAWLVRPYTAPVLKHNPDVDQVLIDSGDSLGALIQLLRAEKFDTAIVSYPRFRTAWALWRAGIPVRIGPASKWYSIFFTKKMWQHRSEGKQNEADYNLELLNELGISFKRYPTRFVLTEEERAAAKKRLESERISFEKPVVFLHPGSGGSSARWPLLHFMKLGDALQEDGAQVVITAGPGEAYQNIMIDQMNRIPVFISAGSVSLRELGALFSWGDLLVANSTGPLHMAVALGVPTVSMYSSQVTCHPKRWGPYPAYVEKDERHQVFLAPSREENGQTEEDMAQIPVQDVRESCRRLIKQRLR